MGSTTRKYMAALVCAAKDEAFVKQHPKYAIMRRERLYAELSARGYKWDNVTEVWSASQEIEVRGGRAVATRVAITRPMNGVFILRIMATKGDIDNIHNELTELAGALGWAIEASGPAFSGGVRNDEWVSIKYTVKRG